MKIVLTFALLIVTVAAKKLKCRLDNEDQDDGLIKRAFEKFDTDDDGIIVIVDVGKLIRQVPTREGNLTSEGTDTDHTSTPPRPSEINGLGGVTRATLKPVKPTSSGYLRIFDKDGDNHISLTEFKKEIKSIMKELGTKMGIGEITNGFKLIDLNGDGKINLREFVGVKFYMFGNSHLESGKPLSIPNNGANRKWGFDATSIKPKCG